VCLCVLRISLEHSGALGAHSREPLQLEKARCFIEAALDGVLFRGVVTVENLEQLERLVVRLPCSRKLPGLEERVAFFPGRCRHYNFR
jgi:hypothetical protein